MQAEIHAYMQAKKSQSNFKGGIIENQTMAFNTREDPILIVN
jgi:hypothetical protein